jgi:hypothetical protein
MENDPLKRLVTLSMINDYLMLKDKKNETIINILKTGEPFTKEDVEQLAQLPLYVKRDEEST